MELSLKRSEWKEKLSKTQEVQKMSTSGNMHHHSQDGFPKDF